MNNVEIIENDREVLRTLAARVLDLSKLEIQKLNREKWYKMNALESEDPIILVSPENSWHEVFPSNSLECRGQLAREWEFDLRQVIYHGEILKDDQVIEAFFDINYVYTDTGWGLELKQEGGEDGGAYHIVPPVKNYEEDFPKLAFPKLIVDYDYTQKLYDLASETFGDLLKVRVTGKWNWTLGMTWDFIKLRGLDHFMMDLILEPQWVHKMMRFLTDGYIERIDFLTKNHIYSSNASEAAIGSGGFGYCRELESRPVINGHITPKNLWGFLESQETVGVSPQMFAEFILPYQIELASHFAMNHYGCCEPIDVRWEYVKTIPNLRRVSSSAWADKAKMAQQLGRNYVISTKPNPAPLAIPKMNEEVIRAEIREILEATKGLNVELIMKDTHTVGNNPRNLSRWVEMCREEVAKI